MSHDALTRIRETARVRLPGALDDAINHELVSVFDEFLRTSSAWQEDLSVAVEPGTKTYSLTAPNHSADIVRLVSVLNEDEIPVRASMPVIGELKLKYDPSKSETLTAKVVVSVAALTYTDGGEDLISYPQWVLDAYRDELLDGLLGRMMSQPAKPYSNERVSIYHLRRFRTGIVKARAATNHRNLQNGQRWNYPYFA